MAELKKSGIFYLKKMEQYGLSDYISIKQKYFDEYQKSLSEEKITIQTTGEFS